MDGVAVNFLTKWGTKQKKILKTDIEGNNNISKIYSCITNKFIMFSNVVG